ncbi:hypothetical protein CK501_11690 [Halovibrio salipaludis]|uniref:DUF2069 domain-containing protein n=1 Tax=Halovibrio salipaludis TaxID=2032626 RepID=A0A2A2F329_9GAMM|nr:DUF2069 domain-containing protein [Halovibrio salipaludis]PAU79856.1 hypothetical protein CK501_11690 [Halovibrio salipaludis]
MTETARRHTDLPLAHWIGLASFFALMAILALTTFWPAPVEGASKAAILAIKLVPLVIFVPGLLRGRNITYIWACFMMMIYFAPLSVSSYLYGWPLTSVIPLILTLVFFVAAMFKLRQDPRNPGITTG